MIHDDILKLCQQIRGDELDAVSDVAEDAGVVEKVGAAQTTSGPEALIAEIDEALEGGELTGDSIGQGQGKVALAMLLAAGDIMASGRG